MQANPRTMDVVVVGGSMAGLFHAIVLKHLGHRVHVLEKSPVSVLQSEAAGLNVGPEVQKLIDEYIKPTRPYTTTSTSVAVVDVRGQIINTVPSNPALQLTTWSQLHSMLKSHVLSGDAASSIKYETEKLVQDVQYSGEKVAVTYLDTKTGKSDTLEADLVIAADGGHSKIRETVLPGQSPEYVGYVTWRGAVSASSISEVSRSTLQNRVLMLRTQEGYIISYYVPSESGSLEPEDCQFIWVWYTMLEKDSNDFHETFTDSAGKSHFSTIPRGKMQPHIWAKIRARGQDLSAPFIELLENTTDPFVSAIRERGATQSVFHEGKLLLVGDAFALCRPHVAMSTNQAARQALGLVEVLQGKSTLEQWQGSAIKYAAVMSALSIAYGGYCFTGKVPDTLRAHLQPDKESKA